MRRSPFRRWSNLLDGLYHLRDQAAHNARAARQKRRKDRLRALPQLEPLEDRLLPATSLWNDGYGWNPSAPTLTDTTT